MDELERALRGVLTDERLDVPVVPDAVSVVRAGVRRRRRRRHAATAVLAAAAVLAGAGLAVGLTGGGNESIRPSGPSSSSPPGDGATKPVVPSLATTTVAWVGQAYDWHHPPAFPGAVPDPAVPWCTAAGLRLSMQGQGAGGALVGNLRVTNVSSAACAVQGQPVVHVVDPAGRRIVGSKPDPFYVDAWVRLRPGAAAAVSLDWSEYCGRATPATVAVDLPHGGGTLRAPVQGPTPRCDVPAQKQPQGTLTSDGFTAYDAHGDLPPFTPQERLQATLDQVPSTVVAGQVLTYRLRLQATEGVVRLSPCLPFREHLLGPAGGLDEVEWTYVLNCPAAPSTIGDATSGQDVEFVMQLYVPTTVPAGDYTLGWQSVLRPVAAVSDALVHVVAAPPPCTSAQLTLSRGSRALGAGQQTDTVVLTNTSNAACTLFGYPAVWFADAAGRQLATRQSTLTVDRPTAVILRPRGGSASFLVLTGTHPATGSACRATGGVVVIPPNLRTRVFVRGVGVDCQGGALSVSVVAAGRSGPPA